jgi:eukaryotic-like serine/threonine-protein kinase
MSEAEHDTIEGEAPAAPRVDVESPALGEDTEPGRADPRDGDGDGRERELVRARLRARLLGKRDVPRLTIGRFHVIKQIGAGGMGSVFSAHDDVLDRKVALKVLRGEPSPEGRLRVLREAQAMARLQHPNVAAVYEVGELDDELHIAMEFIKGASLGAWVKDRPWSEIVEIYRQAGRGLAAAHAAGLVHRDFKPDNVMVDEEGRARVLDFGLVHRDEAVASIALDETAAAGAPLPFDTPLTVTGAHIGTPAYMSPEQFRGHKTDAKSDQFSYCVALYEALYGERPFAGTDLFTFAASVVRGEIARAPRGSSVPSWLRDIVVRGLQVDPDARWPSMRALVDALGRGRRRARLAKASIGIGCVALLGAGVMGFQHVDERRRVAACEATGAELGEAWNDDARAELRDALVATGLSYAETTAEKVMPWLDAQASAWQAARTEACLDARVHGTWDADLLDRSLWCLDERRMELEALVAELSRADADVVAKAVTAAAGLSPVDACRDANLLVRLPPPPSEHREEVRAVRAELSRAAALERAGRYDEGLRAVRLLAARASELGWPPLSAQVWARESSLLEKTGAYEDAERVGADAYHEAAHIGAWNVAAAASTKLVYISFQRAQHTEGLSWGRHAKVALAHAGDDGGHREAARLNNVASAHRGTGSYEEARRLYERALAIWEKTSGPEHPSVATSLNNLAAVNWATGTYEEARGLYERALAIKEKTLGPEHPDVAMSLNGLAAVHQMMGAYEEARGLLERALAIREKALGAAHRDVAASLNNLAVVHRATGAYEQALGLFERALAIQENALGSEHPDIAASLNNLAIMHRVTGAYEEARGLHERALAIQENALDPEHPDIAMSLNNFANLHYMTGAYEQARGLFERALAIQENALGPEHREVARTLNNLANVHRTTGAYEQARGLYERALAIEEKALDPEHPEMAITLSNLALVHQAMGVYEQARGLHERARAIREKALGAEHPSVTTSLVGLADTYTAPGDAEQRRALLERAVVIYDRHEGVQENELEARFTLAEALVATQGDLERARRLAEQARDGYLAAGEGQAEKLAEVEAWLAKHTDTP